MKAEDIALLQQSIGKTVRFLCTDGEIIVAKVDTIDFEDEEIVYEMLSTTNESRYEKHDVQPAYLIHFNEIASIAEAPREG